MKERKTSKKKQQWQTFNGKCVRFPNIFKYFNMHECRQYLLSQAHAQYFIAFLSPSDNLHSMRYIIISFDAFILCDRASSRATLRAFI